MTTRWLLVPLCVTGCLGDLWDDAAALFPDSVGSTSGTGEPTSTGDESPGGGSGVQTVTGETSSTSGPSVGDETTSGGARPSAPPEIHAFSISPTQLTEAGSAVVHLEVSPDVVLVELRVDGELVRSAPPATFAYTFAVTSAAANGTHDFEVRVVDEDGQSVSAGPVELTVLAPPAGAERCTWTETSGSSWLYGVTFQDDAILAVGALSDGNTTRAAIWRLSPDAPCAVQPGWPRTIDLWTGRQEAKDLPSSAVAVAVNEDGYLAIAANLGTGLKRQPYAALLTPTGSRIWEHVGAVGDELAGVAAARFPYENIVVAGSRLIAENPSRYDGVVWSHVPSTDSVTEHVLHAPLQADEFKDLNTTNLRPRAVALHPADDVVYVAGERSFRPLGPLTYERAFIARYSPDGAYLGQWTSDGNWTQHDGARALGMCGDSFVLGGWGRTAVDSKPTPLTRWLAGDGSATLRRPEALVDAMTYGTACDADGKVFSALTQAVAGDLDARALAFRTADGPLSYLVEHDAGTLDGFNAASCDRRGFCVAAGGQNKNGKLQAFAQVFHP